MLDFPEQLELGSVTYTLRRHDDAAVYEGPHGQLGTPTGSVWVRFARDIDAASRAAELERIGFHIERIPGYAPHGAFVTASDAAFALTHLDTLRALDGVEHVEPQMLFEASSR